MAFNLGIADLFRTSPTPAQKPATAAPAGTPSATPADGGMGQANLGADPVNQNLEAGGKGELGADGKPKKDVNPLDSFTDLFKITEDDKKNAPPDPFGEPLLTFDPKKFGEASSKMNFAAGITPEQITKALGGDQQVFASILNRIAQSAFTASAQVFTGILEQGVKKNNSRWDNALDSRFRTLQINSQRPSNTALQHPAAQPMLEALKATIAAKNQNLRPDEVTAKAEEYFITLADSLAAAKPSKDTDKKAPAETDWTAYLGG
jgi:hypothetical protein